MADYRELLRRAIQTLPENNGAARRAVYEKARSALVAQLRAIDPPLPARDITQHRLQLEDCIRQVEQEASEAIISGLRPADGAPRAFAPPPAAPSPEAVPEKEFVPVAPQPEPAAPFEAARDEAVPTQASARVPAEPVATTVIVPEVASAATKPAEVQARRSVTASESKPAGIAPATEPGEVFSPESIEDIIALAESAVGSEEHNPGSDKPDAGGSAEPQAARSPGDAQPVAANVASLPTGKPAAVIAGFPGVRSHGGGSAGAGFQPRPDSFRVTAANSSAQVRPLTPRVEPGVQAQAVARQVVTPIAVVTEPQVGAAMSSVREVELDPVIADNGVADPQDAIDRAIATLDREARGESPSVVLPEAGAIVTPFEQVKVAPAPAAADTVDLREPAGDDTSFTRPSVDMARSGGGALTIFLLVFLVLLLGAGGAGFWAWREGFIDLNTMFGQTQPAVEEAEAPTEPPQPDVPPTASLPADPAPGNTITTPESTRPPQELAGDERLIPETPPAVPSEPAAPVTATAPAAEDKSEERLPSANAETGTQGAEAQLPAVDATALAGSQSLLLEASDTGTTGAVPFSGTVEWSKGTDELGQPTLVAAANIPARNLGVNMLIRKNADPSLPASHLMEINFSVSETFLGGSIAGLPGVLLKNEELVQGTPLVGASARVVGNSFLFALSASEADSATNNNLLTSRKWLDLAIIYATGKRAIITLEKDSDAEALFTEVFAEWAKAPATAQAQ